MNRGGGVEVVGGMHLPRGGARRVTHRLVALVIAGASFAVAAACGTESSVAVERSRDLGERPTQSDPTDPTSDPTAPTDPTTDPSSNTDPTTDPTDPTDPTGSTPPTRPASDLINEGNAKPERSYDALIEATVVDLEQWWAQRYPELYGEPYRSLEGGIYPAYPERTDPIPGCGTDESTYPNVQQYVAFYCSIGDFIAYDDGDSSLLVELSEQLGDSVLAVVLAHEWGHAIQERNGTFGQRPATIVTEQQADCFSGAWTARARQGEIAGVEFSDQDVRSGLAALITVRDPIDVDSQEPGAHGAGFDRVGAFQVGYLQGLERCAELIDDPLPLVPNQFAPTATDRDGNAPFEDVTADEPGIVTIVESDLNRYWPLVFGGTGTDFPTLTAQAAPDPTNTGCPEAGNVEEAASYCSSDDTVYFDEDHMRELYEQFGDFAVGYVLGDAWAEAAQAALGSPLANEPRSLLNDCLNGSWVSNILPDENGNLPTQDSAVIEPGDLDEAIQTILLSGDETAEDNVEGTAFEKIDAFRDGVLNTLNTCTDRIPD